MAKELLGTYLAIATLGIGNARLKLGATTKEPLCRDNAIALSLIIQYIYTTHRHHVV
jgi:hypothetical protein